MEPGQHTSTWTTAKKLTKVPSCCSAHLNNTPWSSSSGPSGAGIWLVIASLPLSHSVPPRQAFWNPHSIRTLPRCLAPRQSRPFLSCSSHDHLGIPPPDLTAMPDQTILGRYPSRAPLHDAAGPALLLWWQRHAISLIAAACHGPSPSPSIALGRQRRC